MVSKEEIIVMTKLAIYDKNYGLYDKKANESYYKDYLYIKNFYARFLALMGCFVLILLYSFIIFLDDDLDLFAINFRLIGLYIAGIVAIVMILYTFISTRIYSNKYKNIKRRLRVYFRLIKELENLKDKRLFNENEKTIDI